MTKSLKVSEDVHALHKIKCALAGVTIEDATNDAIRDFWDRRKGSANRRRAVQVPSPVRKVSK